MNIKEWIDKQKHLPSCMRDFHDQKDLFKAISETMGKPEDESYDVNWVKAHCYTMDRFLNFMAQCGYTLQKNRSAVDFCDLDAVVNEQRKKRQDMFIKALKSRRETSDDSTVSEEGD